jgi:hypothetical protein
VAPRSAGNHGAERPHGIGVAWRAGDMGARVSPTLARLGRGNPARWVYGHPNGLGYRPHKTYYVKSTWPGWQAQAEGWPGWQAQAEGWPGWRARAEGWPGWRARAEGWPGWRARAEGWPGWRARAEGWPHATRYLVRP